MPRDKLPNQPDPERDLLDKLFGTPDEMADEDLDMLYEAIAPARDAAAIIHRLAADAAVEYRTQNRLPPDHVQAALDATQEVKRLDNLAPSKLRRIVDTLTALTPAERRVFPLLLDPALTRKEIAARLGVAPRTVQCHVDHICEKLGITAHYRRAELIARYGAPADRMADLEQRVAALEARCGE